MAAGSGALKYMMYGVCLVPTTDTSGLGAILFIS